MSGPAFASSGDQIIAYQGSSGDPTFLFAMNSEQTGWQDDATNANTSAIPEGLTNGTNAIAFIETDNGYYSGAIGATGATMLSYVCDKDNWTTSDSRLDPGDYDPLPIRFSVSISGSSNHFRMMSSPVAGQIYSDLLSELWTQGMTGADVTSGVNNVWTYSGTGWTDVTDISGSGSGASLTAGQGFLVYVYVDTDNDGDTGDTGESGYLPVTLSVAGNENSATVSISTTEDADDDGEGGGAGTGWNLLGNPFATTIDADELFTDNTKFKDVVYVYDHSGSSASSPDEDVSGGGIYRAWNSSAGSLTGGLIAPYQGFFVQTDTDWESGQITSFRQMLSPALLAHSIKQWQTAQAV